MMTLILLAGHEVTVAAQLVIVYVMVVYTVAVVELAIEALVEMAVGKVMLLEVIRGEEIAVPEEEELKMVEGNFALRTCNIGPHSRAKKENIDFKCAFMAECLNIVSHLRRHVVFEVISYVVNTYQ